VAVKTVKSGVLATSLLRPKVNTLREYNGKWYNTIKCFKLELLNAKVSPKKATKAAKSVVVEEEEGTDDLPF